MASLSLLKNWLDDALLPYVQHHMALAAETLEAFVSVWPEDALARSVLVSAWLNLLEDAGEDEAAALCEKLKAQRDFLLAPEEPAGWLSAWNRARFLHLCRARPAVEAPRSQLALFAALRDVDMTLAFSPFDFHAQATKARVLRGLERDKDAFRIVRAVDTLLSGFNGLEDFLRDEAYLSWRKQPGPPVESFAHEPSVPTAVASALRLWPEADAWHRARDAALGALALELERSPAELTLVHPAQVDAWRGRFFRVGSTVELSTHALMLLRHWLVMSRNHPELRGGPRRYLFPRWEDLEPLSLEDVEARFKASAFVKSPHPASDESSAVFGILSAGSADRVHEAFPEEEGARADVFCRTPEDFPALLRRLASGRVRHLRLHGQVGTGALSRLARASGAEGLRSLHLTLCEIDAEGTKLLSRSPAFAGLRELVLDCNRFGPEGLAALVEGPGLEHLRSLSLMGCRLGPEGVDRLGRSALVRRLRVLDIGSNELEDGLRGWGSQEESWALEVLGLSENYAVKGEDLFAWLRSPAAANLRWLDAYYNGLGDGLLMAVADSPHLGRLAVLSAGRNGFTPTGLEALARSRRPLVWLGFSGNHLGPEGTAVLARAPGLDRVTHLGLSATDADPEPLLASGHLGRLVSLDLSDCGLPEGLEERFAAAPGLRRLEQLSLRTHEYE